jgi:hypothetical protein
MISFLGAVSNQVSSTHACSHRGKNRRGKNAINNTLKSTYFIISFAFYFGPEPPPPPPPPRPPVLPVPRPLKLPLSGPPFPAP